ncbi:MAG: RICIN domain-containing protein [Nannocystaceae bacterium]
MEEFVRPILYRAQPVAILAYGTNLALTGGGKGGQCSVEHYTGAETQHWTIHALPEAAGFYRVTNAATGLVLDVSGVSKEAGATVHTWDRLIDQSNQQLHLRWNIDGGFLLRFRHSGQVLDIKGGSTAAGAKIIQWPAHGGENQRWLIGDALSAFEAIALTSSHGKSVSAWSDGGLRNQVEHFQSWETFKIRRVAGVGPVSFGDAIALECHDGTFVTASPGGELSHAATEINAWERFTVTRPDGGTDGKRWFTGMPFALRTAHGTYVMASPDGSMSCPVTTPKSWERFIATWPMNQEQVAADTIYRTRKGDKLRLKIAQLTCVAPGGSTDSGNVSEVMDKIEWKLSHDLVDVLVNPITQASLLIQLQVAALSDLYDHVATTVSGLIGGSDPDQLYLRKGGGKIWPSGTYKEVARGETVTASVVTDFGADGVWVDLMEYDSGSGDDKLGTIYLPTAGHEIDVGAGASYETFPVGNPDEGSVYMVRCVIYRE